MLAHNKEVIDSGFLRRKAETLQAGAEFFQGSVVAILTTRNREIPADDVRRFLEGQLIADVRIQEILLFWRELITAVLKRPSLLVGNQFAERIVTALCFNWRRLPWPVFQRAASKIAGSCPQIRTEALAN